jgi:hypothetical protein
MLESSTNPGVKEMGFVEISIWRRGVISHGRLVILLLQTDILVGI